MSQSNTSYSSLLSDLAFYNLYQRIYNSLSQAITYISIYLILRIMSLHFQQAHRVSDAYATLIRKLCARKPPFLSVIDTQMQKSIIIVAPYTRKQVSWLLLLRSIVTPPKTLFVRSTYYDLQPGTIHALESKEQQNSRCKKSGISWPPRKDDGINDVVQRTLPGDLLGLWKRHEISMENYVRFFQGQPSQRRRKCTSGRQPQQIQNNALPLHDVNDSLTTSRSNLYHFARDVLSYYEKEYGYQRGTPEAERIAFLRQAISDFTS